MASNGGRINFQVGFNVDKSGLNSLKSSLQSLQKIKIADFSGTREELRQVKDTAATVQAALQKAFNVNLGSVNLNTFNQQLQRAGLSIDKVYQNLSKAGGQGKAAFVQMSSSIMSTNLQLRETTSLVSKMGQTMANTIKWGITSSIMQGFTNSVRQAFQYVEALDASLTDIRIVTGDSTEQMRQFAQEANNAAQSLGRSTMDYTRAALTFYQQGLDDQSVAARTQATLQAQNITGAGDEMADYLTAVWNGYKVANEQAELYVDRLAAVADSSASNMAQLATAMSKVAATANAMGVDVDQLNAQIATIIATTRQAPQTVGNALKTIFARINDIQAGTEDAEVSLGHYTGAMAELGINVLDTSGHLRDTGQVMEEIGQKWQTMSREQQIYLARTMAGQRQYNNLIALFDNWGRYTELVNVSMDSQGTLMEKNSRYMDSMGAKLQQLGAAGEKVKDALIDEEDMKGLITAATNIVNVFGSFIQSIGGARGALLAFGSIAMQVFSGTISKQISNLVLNIQNARQNQSLLNQQIEKVRMLSQSKGYSEGLIKDLVNQKAAIQSYYSVMSTEQIKAYNQLHNRYGVLQSQNVILEDQIKKTETLGKYIQATTSSEEEANAALLKINQVVEDRIKPGLQEISNIKLNALFDPKEASLLPFIKMQARLQELKNQTGQTFPEIQTYLNKLNTLIQTSPSDRTRKDFQDLKDLLLQIGNVSDRTLEAMGMDAQKLAQKLGISTAQAEALLAKMKQMQQQKALQYNIKSVMGLVAGLGQIASGINSIVNLTKIWKNENLSFGEKVLQTFTNLSMTIGMFANGLMQVINNAKKLVPVIIDIGTKILGPKIAQAGANEAVAATATQAAGAEGAKSAADAVQAGTAKAAAEANWGLAASIGAIIGTLTPFLLIAGAAIATGYSLYKMWNSASEAAANAAESAAQAKEKYEQVKQAYEDLKASFENYDSIQNSLRDLTRGTQEWRDALLQANNVVLQLLSTYPQLAAELNRDENGMLILSQQARENLLQNQMQQLLAARGASIIASIESRDAATNARAAGLGHEAFGMGLANESSLIDYTGSPQLVSQIARQYAEGITDSAEIAQLIGVSKSVVDALLQTNNREQLLRIGQQLISNQEATRLNYQTLASQSLMEQSAYQVLSENERDVADAVLGLDLEKQVNQITRSLEIAQTSISRFTSGGSQTMQQLLTRYINATGAQGTRWQSNAVTSENGQLVFHLVDANGNEFDPTQDLFNQTIAVAEALQEIQGNTLETVTQMLDAISDFQSQAAAQGVRRLLSNQDLSSLTSDQLDALSQRPDELQRFFSNEDNYTAAGYQSGEAFANAFYESVNNAQQRFENVLLKYAGTSLFESVRSILEGGDFSLAASQNITKAIEQAFQHGGQNGVNSLMGMLENIDPQNLEEVYNLLGGVDWTAPDAVYQLQSGLSNLGISVEDLGPDFEEFCNWIDRTANSAYNALDPLAKLKNLFNSFNEIQDLAPGEVIDDQLYQKLADLAPELRELFIEAANGHLFIGAQQDVYNILNNQTENLIEQFENAKQAAQQLLDNDISGLFSNINLPTTPGQAVSQNDISAYRELLSNDIFGQGLDAVGVSRDQIDADLQWLEQHSETAYQNLNQRQQQTYDSTVSRLNSVLDRIDQLQTRAENGDFGDQSRYQVVAAQAFEYDNPIQQLRNFVRQNQTTVEMYNQVRDAAVEREVERLDITREAYDQTFSVLYNHLQNTSESFQSLTEEQKNIQLDQLTIQVYQLGQALDDLAQMSSEDFQLIQQHLNGIVSADSAQAIGTLQEKLINIFDVPINTKFIEQNFDLIQRLAYGDITALDQLQRALGQDYVATLRAQTDDVQIQSELDNLSNIINGIDFNDIQIGMSLDDAPFADALIDAALRAGMSADEINELLAGIGFQPEVTSQWIPFQELTDGYNRYTSTYHYVAPDGTETDIPVSIEQYNAASGAGGIEIPIINNKKIKYTGGSRAAQMARPSYTGAKRPSGGGGGGGKSSGSTAKPTVQKPSQDTRDPYHDINRLLDKQEQKLKNIQNQDKKLVNRDRLNNINAQNKALEEQANLLENKLAIAESQEIRLRNQLLADTNGYAHFGANGQITNFNQMLANAEKQYNNYIAYYNTLSKQQQDAEKDRLDLEKERYQRVKKTADEYEKTLDLQRDLLEQINENQEKQYENLIKQSQIRVDLAVDTGDLEREYLDFENKFIKKLDKDNFLGNAKANVKELMSYFNSDQIKKRNEEINSLNAIIQRIEKHGGGAYVDPSTGYNLAAAQERLSELFKDQTKALEEIDDLVKEIQELYLDSLKNAKDKMDDQIDQYERVGELLEHNAKLAQLIYGDKAYATLEKYYILQQQNDERALRNLRMQQQYWQNQLNNEEVGSEAWLAIKKNLDDVTDDLNDKLEDMIDRLADQWQVRAKKITDQMNNALTGGRGLDYLGEQWDYISDYDDNFLDTLESKFGIQQVETLYQQAIDSIQGDHRGQQRLNKLMNDQLKLLRQKDKLTEYDVQRAKAALEVEKARMAIEQARDSKTKMRLRRDSQGNYTYQYVADENKLSDLQQALNDAQANLYNIDKQHYTQNLNKIIDAYRDFQQKYNELSWQQAQANAAGDKEQAERIQARIDLLQESYKNLLDGLTEDNQYSLKYLAESFGSGMGFEQAQYKAEGFIKVMQQNIPHVGGEVQKLTNAIIADGGLLSALNQLMVGFDISNMQYVNGVQSYLAEVGTSVETIMKVADAYGNVMDSAINKAQEFIPYYDKMIADSVDAIDQIRESIEQVEKVLDKNLDDSSLVKTLETAVNLLQDLNRYRNSKTGQIAKDVNIKAPNVVDRNIDTTEEGAGVITAQDWKNYLNNQSTSQPITLASINAITQLDTDTLNSLSNSDLLLNVIGTVKYLTESMGSLVDKELAGLIKEASSYIGSIDNVETLNQNVHIEANFPNVRQHEEIRLAIQNLVNVASQKAMT